MTKSELLAYAAEQYGTEAEYPWDDPNAVLRHRENKKWYAVILEVRRDRLGLSGEDTVDVLNVKCDPRLIGSLREQPGFHPAYHMNKEQWLSIRLDGSVPEEQIHMLLSMSYELTGLKRKHKKPISEEKA